ncbi:MAG: UDP-glucose dehydrogenase family protein [Myxococcota bacterium]
MKVAVIGTGYVGLVTGACLANVGNTVTCVDKDTSKIEMLENGEVPIYEEGLAPIVERNYEDGRLEFTTDTASAVKSAEVIFIAVGTPPDEDGSADLSHVLAVARDIGNAMDEQKIVVCKSTVPVGTCDKVGEVISGLTDHGVHVVSNPEFLKEGTAINDFQSPDRVVIGCADRDAAKTVGELYKPFMRRSERIVYMGVRSAEMTKYASNAMLATKISFINEVASICDRVGANIEDVRTGMSLDERIGPHFIYPGVGFGGSCFPKDIRALGRIGKESGAQTSMLDAVESVNISQKLTLYRAAKDMFGSLEDKRLAVWGLSFKPRTDDVREAPALVNIEKFVEDGASVAATDPEAIENAKRALAEQAGAVEYLDDDYAVLDGADALFIFTEWEQFRSPDFDRMKSLMNAPVVFDGRNLYRPEKMRDHGFDYVSVGRPQ